MTTNPISADELTFEDVASLALATAIYLAQEDEKVMAIISMIAEDIKEGLFPSEEKRTGSDSGNAE
jgi:hypothetical protein